MINDSNEENIEINENLKKDIDKTIQKNEVVLPDYTNLPYKVILDGVLLVQKKEQESVLK